MSFGETEKFGLTCAAIAGTEAEASVPNSHTAELTLAAAKRCDFVLLVAAVAEDRLSALSREAEAAAGADTAAGAGTRLEARAEALLGAATRDLDRLDGAHRTSWRGFWEKSFVSIEDDYVENLYYLNLYALNSCSRGRYPVNFTGGGWTWNGDIRNWGHFYHWNAQQTYWCAYASNHPELAENYLAFRFGMLENAKRDAREIFGADGAYFSDICDYNGFQAVEPDTVRNFTVGSQIAMDFYRHYRYTGDKEFLEKKALPVMRACAEFYRARLENDGGRYRLKGGSTAYESYWNLRETITDYSGIKTLFSALI